MVDELHLVELQLDPRGLFPRGRREGADDGYRVHATLCALFGTACVQPFLLDPGAQLGQGRSGLQVLGYSRLNGEALSRAYAAAEAGSRRHLRPGTLRARPFPATWAVGRTVGFRVRVCPTVRLAGEVERPPSPDHPQAGRLRAGAEVDAWLAAVWREDPRSREAVYLDWTRERLERGGASLDRGAVLGWRLTEQYRREQEGDRPGSPRRRPEAVIEGVATVTDTVAFRELLARGLGRHRAFGFGMMLLMPASRAC